MALIPRWLLRHTVTVEPFQGQTGAGPAFGAPTTVRCFVQDGQRLVRGQNADQVLSSATIRMLPTAVCPVGSRVTFSSGRVATVLVANQQSGGGLPTPDHLEVMTT